MTKPITVDAVALQRGLTALANAVATINDLNSNYGAESVDAVAKEGKDSLDALLGLPTGETVQPSQVDLAAWKALATNVGTFSKANHPVMPYQADLLRGGVPPTTDKVELDPAGVRKIKMTVLEYKAVQVINTIKALCDGGSIQLPVDVQIDIDVVLGVATTRRVGVR